MTDQRPATDLRPELLGTAEELTMYFSPTTLKRARYALVLQRLYQAGQLAPRPVFTGQINESLLVGQDFRFEVVGVLTDSRYTTLLLRIYLITRKVAEGIDRSQLGRFVVVRMPRINVIQIHGRRIVDIIGYPQANDTSEVAGQRRREAHSLAWKALLE